MIKLLINSRNKNLFFKLYKYFNNNYENFDEIEEKKYKLLIYIKQNLIIVTLNQIKIFYLDLFY